MGLFHIISDVNNKNIRY